MKAVKKLVSAFVALACSVGMTVPVGASAEEEFYADENCISINASYDPRDVNHDGTVNTTDSLIVGRYLSGLYKCDTYYQLDADQNMIVDASDILCIEKYLLGQTYTAKYVNRTHDSSGWHSADITPPAINGYAVDGSASSQTTRSYRVKNYSSGSTETYTLTPSTTVLPTAIGDNTEGFIHDPAQIYTSNFSENKGIVAITVTKYNNDGTSENLTATGFIVGDNEIATAAHVLYQKDNTHDLFRPLISVHTYNQNGTQSSSTLTPIEGHIPTAYISAKNTSIQNNESNAAALRRSSQFDYALLVVDEDLSSYTHYSLAEAYNLNKSSGTPSFMSIPIYCTGVPKETTQGSGNNSSQHLYTGYGNTLNKNNSSGVSYYNNFVLYHNIDTTGGNSGSPIYSIVHDNKGNYFYTVIAIHDGGVALPSPATTFDYNCGCRITRYQLQFYKNNPNIGITLNMS